MWQIALTDFLMLNKPWTSWIIPKLSCYIYYPFLYIVRFAWVIVCWELCSCIHECYFIYFFNLPSCLWHWRIIGVIYSFGMFLNIHLFGGIGFVFSFHKCWVKCTREIICFWSFLWEMIIRNIISLIEGF